jgi:hypothetical protein
MNSVLQAILVVASVSISMSFFSWIASALAGDYWRQMGMLVGLAVVMCLLYISLVAYPNSKKQLTSYDKRGES